MCQRSSYSTCSREFPCTRLQIVSALVWREVSKCQPVSCLSFQYSVNNSCSSAWLAFRCSAIYLHVKHATSCRNEVGQTLSSKLSASPRYSSTWRSLSRRSIAISSYSRWRRSIVFWLVCFLSSVYRWARSSFSRAFESCFSTRC